MPNIIQILFELKIMDTGISLELRSYLNNSKERSNALQGSSRMNSNMIYDGLCLRYNKVSNTVLSTIFISNFERLCLRYIFTDADNLFD